MDQPDAAARSVATAPGSGCTVSEKWTGSIAVIAVAGVLDMLTSPRLRAVVTECLQKKPSAIIIDLSEVGFLASAGMGVLVAAREQAGPGVGFGVVASGPATSRPLTLVGLADLLGLHPTLEQAHAAVDGQRSGS